ncbi:uncharacterized protein [Centruroides vittatus]
MWKACCIAVSSFTPLDFQPMMKHVASWLVLFATSVIAVEDKLQCYQCLVSDNKLCTEEFLAPCPTSQAFDRCMTIISNSKDEGYQIEKKCALAPCSLRDPSQNTGLGLDHCDRSKAEFSCISCCKGDGCNKDGSENLQSFSSYIILVLCHLLGFFYNRIII